MRKIISILVIMLLISIAWQNCVLAEGDIAAIKAKMAEVSQAPGDYSTSETAKIINTVIGIIQITGTGISLVVISMLGIKYLMASPSDKADVKKNIMPILIGCVLLFAAMQIIEIVENFTNSAGLVGGG